MCYINTVGLYKYKRLPMGIKQSSDIAQEVMENLLRDIDDVEIYIDDIGCFSSTFSSHIQTLDIILTRIEQMDSRSIPPSVNGLFKKQTG